MTRVLGSGCRTCQTTADVIAQAAKEVGVKIRPVKVTDIAGIMSHGEMSTPGVVVDGPLVSRGRLVRTGRGPGVDRRLLIASAPGFVPLVRGLSGSCLRSSPGCGAMDLPRSRSL